MSKEKMVIPIGEAARIVFHLEGAHCPSLLNGLDVIMTIHNHGEGDVELLRTGLKAYGTRTQRTVDRFPATYCWREDAYKYISNNLAYLLDVAGYVLGQHVQPLTFLVHNHDTAKVKFTLQTGAINGCTNADVEGTVIYYKPTAHVELVSVHIPDSAQRAAVEKVPMVLWASAVNSYFSDNKKQILAANKVRVVDICFNLYVELHQIKKLITPDTETKVTFQLPASIAGNKRIEAKFTAYVSSTILEPDTNLQLYIYDLDSPYGDTLEWLSLRENTLKVLTDARTPVAEQIVNEIKAITARVPSLRVGQLIHNAMFWAEKQLRYRGDLFNIDDKSLLEAIKIASTAIK